MIVVKVMGGLGNQMFQYAFYKKLSMLYKYVYIDDRELRVNGNEHNGLELESVFGLNYHKIREVQLKLFMDRPHSHKLLYGGVDFLIKSFGYQKMQYYCEKEYDPDIFLNQDRYYIGYWGNQRYWGDIAELLKKEFSFRFNHFIDRKNIEILEEIKNTCSVSIHIRRGDYLKEENIRLFGGICTTDYYRVAINHFISKFGNPTFYIFSNDNVDDILRIFKEAKFRVVDWNKGENSYIDMFLMSKCKHNIIANSTFSWWGSWLNENPDRIIIVPHRFNNINGRVKSSNWPEGYFQIDYLDDELG